MEPIGGYLTVSGDIELCPGRRRVQLEVANTGDRPIQVGSHYHFFEVNAALQFDREAAWGMRLDIPAGTGRRFEPGMTLIVTLVEFGGRRHMAGFRDLGANRLDTATPLLDEKQDTDFPTDHAPMPKGDANK
ncbi:MAG: urease subunit beta [Firmicutes bacterium]|nr:urease subunit beta [Bacillota bacterium]